MFKPNIQLTLLFGYQSFSTSLRAIIFISLLKFSVVCSRLNQHRFGILFQVMQLGEEGTEGIQGVEMLENACLTSPACMHGAALSRSAFPLRRIQSSARKVILEDHSKG
jgi:hypothetical protein